MRGPGERYGVRQSGIADLKLAWLTDAVTIKKSRKDAEELIEKDPHLNQYPKLKEKISKYEDVYVKD